MAKENVVYTFNGILFSLKKGNPAIWDDIEDLEGIILHEMSDRKTSNA